MSRPDLGITFTGEDGGMLDNGLIGGISSQFQEDKENASRLALRKQVIQLIAGDDDSP